MLLNALRCQGHIWISDWKPETNMVGEQKRPAHARSYYTEAASVTVTFLLPNCLHSGSPKC